MTIIKTPEDKRWLKEVLLPDVPMNSYKIALLYGNESCPRKIELYAKDDYRSKSATYVDHDGKMVKA